MKKSRIFRIIIAALLLSHAFTISALANTPDDNTDIYNCQIISSETGIQPYWDNTSSASCEIVFIGTTGYATASVNGKSGTTSIEGTLTLYRKSGIRWIYVTEWTSSSTGLPISIDGEFTGTSGVTYKVVLEAEVTCGTTEPIELEYQKKCPWVSKNNEIFYYSDRYYSINVKTVSLPDLLEMWK